MSKRLAISTMCAVAALVGGCHRGAPEGQVAATVNGQEVTLQELNAEIQASNVPPNAPKQDAQKAALQHIIDRKLLVAAARDKKIDKSPEFQSMKLRADELLLAEAYAKQQLAAVPVPTDAEITKFMADHPNAFSNREQIQLDQLRFRPSTQEEFNKALAAIKGDHSLEAVAGHLSGMGIRFDRAQAGLDTAQIPTNLVKEINGLPAGEPFVLPGNGFVTVNAVTGHRSLPTDPGQARQAAVGAWRNEKFTQLIGDQLKQMRASAKINYQNGFAPPADNGKTPPASNTPAASNTTGALGQ